MSKEIYYGTKKNQSITYLEFGEIDLKNTLKKIWDFKLDQKAYDWLMFSRYANDILGFKQMISFLEKDNIDEVMNIYNREIHHSNEASLSLQKLIALSLFKDETSFIELGQTIFGCIDAMEFYIHLLKYFNLNFIKIDLKKSKWFGVDISHMFNEFSKILHYNYHVETFNNIKNVSKKSSVFFAKGISLLYSVRNIEDLFKIIEKGQCSIFDYSLSTNDIQDTTIGSGKNVRYLKLNDFINEYKNRGRKIYVNKNNSKLNEKENKIWIDCLYADETLCKKFINKDNQIRNQIFNKLHLNPLANRFLDNTNESNWIEITEFLNTVK